MLFSSQFQSLGKEQWQCLLAFTLLDSVAEGSVRLADSSFQCCSLAYPLNREGEYEVMIGQDWQVESEVLDFVTKTNTILSEFQSVSPASLLRLLEGIVFVDETIVEKWGVFGMVDGQTSHETASVVFFLAHNSLHLSPNRVVFVQ